MPKVLIIESCLINLGDDRGGVDHAAPSIVDIAKDTAHKLVTAGRALYAARADDPDKGGRNTATKDMLDVAKVMIAAREKAAVQTSEQGGE
ncbi:MAG: hypothetical protein H6948_16130 [Zoogloeaceae bacterium]|nr:hypothetical protein [Zoogloeaceae bacterium]